MRHQKNQGVYHSVWGAEEAIHLRPVEAPFELTISIASSVSASPVRSADRLPTMKALTTLQSATATMRGIDLVAEQK